MLIAKVKFVCLQTELHISPGAAGQGMVFGLFVLNRVYDLT